MSGIAGKAEIINGAIVIQVPIENLPSAVEGGCRLGVYVAPFRVDDAAEFASDVVAELNDEDEQGTTRIHKLFDRAFEAAVESGAFGVVHQFQCDQCGHIADESEEASHDCDEAAEAEAKKLREQLSEQERFPAAMPKFRKKPVEIEAMHFTGALGNSDEIIEWAQRYGVNITLGLDENDCEFLTIPTLEGDHRATIDDRIIRGIANEFYPCKPDIFEATYDVAE